MPEYFTPPPDYITTHDVVLGLPVLCTALLTLILLSSFMNVPAPPPRLGVIKQVHHCTARSLQQTVQEQHC